MVGTLSWFCPPTLPDGYADGQEPCWRCKQTVCGWASLRTHSRAERTVAYVTPPAMSLTSCDALYHIEVIARQPNCCLVLCVGVSPEF